jgi:regulator of RNase E activity RraA
LRVKAREGLPWRTGRIDPHGVLGEIPPDRGREAVARGIVAKSAHERGDGVGGVVITGATRGRQTAGDGQWPIGLIDSEPQFACGELDCGRKT